VGYLSRDFDICPGGGYIKGVLNLLVLENIGEEIAQFEDIWFEIY
jgi:hypothetical protein